MAVKVRQLHHNYSFDGRVPEGTYSTKGVVKIAEVLWRKDTVHPCVITKLLPTYWNGSQVVLKKHKETICFEIVFYSELETRDNLLFLNNYIRNLSKAEKCDFLQRHAQALAIVLKEAFESFYLQTIFNMGKIPEQFEVWHNGKRVVKLNSVKQDYKSNPKEFSLISYQKLN